MTGLGWLKIARAHMSKVAACQYDDIIIIIKILFTHGGGYFIYIK